MKLYYVTTSKIVEETYEIQATDFEEVEGNFDTGIVIDYKEYDENIIQTQLAPKEDNK